MVVEVIVVGAPGGAPTMAGSVRSRLWAVGNLNRATKL